jgi:ATP-dependent RNA helicase DDX49/DBP8
VSLHSSLPQNKRLSNLSAFRSGHVKILIATDVASRGLDIPSVEMVVNYDLPREAEDYIHRVGRTARANREGRSLSFVTQYDVQRVLAIEEKIGKKLYEFAVDEQEVLRHLNETTIAKTKAEMVK